MITYGHVEDPPHAIKIHMVADVPIGDALLTTEGYLLYCTENEQYLTYSSIVDGKLCWVEEPDQLFLSEDFDDTPMNLLMVIDDIKNFVGKEKYPSCITVPTVRYCRQVNEEENIIEVYLIKDFRRAFPWNDIAPWNRP